MSVIIKTPGSVDLKELYRLTEDSVAFLKPWYEAKDGEKSVVLRSISDKAHHYTEAIGNSVKAAQYGHDVASSALDFAKLVKKPDTSTEECNSFAKIMLECASKAYARAHESLEKFKNVRQELNELIRTARASGDHDHAKGILDELENQGIPTLEKLVKCIGKYIEWWNFIALRANAQIVGAKNLTFNYTKMGESGTIKRWEEIKESFVQYTLEITKLQDTYPSMFITTGTIDAKLETPTTENSDAQHEDVEQHLNRIATMRTAFKRPMAIRAWGSFSSFARSLICL